MQIRSMFLMVEVKMDTRYDTDSNRENISYPCSFSTWITPETLLDPRRWDLLGQQIRCDITRAIDR